MIEIDLLDRDTGLHEEILEICGAVAQATEEELLAVTDVLIALGQAHGPEQLERILRDPQIMKARAHLAPVYAGDVRRRELESVQQLLGLPRLCLDDGSEFARSTYARVQVMFDHIDFGGCARFVMVGCGPLPATLWHVRDATTVPELVGLDVDAEAVEWARELLGAIDPARMRIECSAGENAHFGNADVIYVANLVSAKADVIARIAKTARPGTQVVLRDPFSVGLLLAECGADVLGDRFRLTGQGSPGLRFYSKHVFATVA